MEVLRTRLCEWEPIGIDALAFSPRTEEPRLAVGRASGAVELWDTTTWHLHSSSQGHARRSIRDFAWFQEEDEGGWRIISAGLHKDITEWDLASLQPQVSVPSGGGAVWALRAQGSRAIAACDDGTVRVFSLKGGPGSVSYQRQLKVSSLRLLSITEFDSDFVFAGGSDSHISKWSLATGTCEAKMQVEKSPQSETLVWSLVRLGNSAIASGDSLGLVQVWDPVVCTVLHRFESHQADVLTLAASPKGDILLSGGIDAQVCTFAHQSGGEDRWMFVNSDFCHTHDIRSIAFDRFDAIRSFASGGVCGRLHFHALAKTLKKRKLGLDAAPITCSSFSPFFQSATVAQGSRLLLCQRNEHLELWYLKQPKLPSSLSGDLEALASLEGELAMRIALSGAEEGQHICASALSPSGDVLAASDATGSRLFRLNLEELEVRREVKLSSEVRKTPARAMLFCGTKLLALATWSTNEVLLVDVVQLSVVARFTEHNAPVSQLAASGEWLASADVTGGVHIFNLDSLEHHTKVPIGQGIPTALAFHAQRSQLIVVTSSHNLVVFDVEAQALINHDATESGSLEVPKGMVPSHVRICGVASPLGHPNKLLLWGHSFMLGLDLRPKTHEAFPTSSGDADNDVTVVVKDKDNCRWRRYDGMQHILALCMLDESQWGATLLRRE
jgi:U3 small nucleolar RNA-associated protein 4